MSVNAPTRPRRTLLVAHLGWEAVLLLAAVVLLGLTLDRLDGHPAWPWLAGPLTIFGLQAGALAVSLRTRTLNLAVGAITAGASLLIVIWVQDGRSFWVGVLIVVLAALVTGAVVGALVGLTAAPSWAVSLALLAGITAAVRATDQNGFRWLDSRAVPDHQYTVLAVLFGLFVTVSLAGGVLWSVGPVRRALAGDPRPPAGPAADSGLLAGVTGFPPAGEPLGSRVRRSVVGYAGSTVLAALAGVASALYLRAAQPSSVNDLLLPLAIVLLGGVSAYGGRGGIAGTVLATLVVVGAQNILVLDGVGSWAVAGLVTGLGILIGSGVSAVMRVLERPAVPGRAAIPGGSAVPGGLPGRSAPGAAGWQAPAIPAPPASPPVSAPPAQAAAAQPAGPIQPVGPAQPAPPGVTRGRSDTAQAAEATTARPTHAPPSWPTPQGTIETDVTRRLKPPEPQPPEPQPPEPQPRD